MDLITLIVMGALAGVMAGLLGIGGGAIIVPVLAMVFESQGVAPDLVMKVALGTSLATIIFTAISSTLAHHRRGAVDWSIVRKLAPVVVVATLLGAVVADSLTNRTLKIIFILFMFSIAIQMARGTAAAKARTQLPGMLGMNLAGGTIGIASALFGIGGGSLVVPFLTWCSVHIKRAVATGAAIGVPVAISGTIGYILTGWNAPDLPSGSVGYIVVPAFAGIVIASTLAAPLGAKLAHRMSAITLRRVFAVVLVGLGLRMLWSIL